MRKKKSKDKSNSYPIYTSTNDDEPGMYIQNRLETCEKCCHTYEPSPECKDIHQYRFIKCGMNSENCSREQECLRKCIQTRGSSKEDLEFCRHIECG